MKTVRPWVHLAISVMCVGFLGFAAPGFAGQTVGVTDDTIKIGSFGALTGPYYLFGKLIMNGAEVVYNDVNKQGGIHGRKLTLIREDDRCDAATAIAAAKKLIYQHEVFMIHGGGCSNPAIAAREEIERANVPWVVFAAVADPITMPVAPYIWSTALTASRESRAQVDFAKARGAKRLAIIAQHDAWGNARYKPLVEKLKEEGIPPVADEEIGGDANDATTQVLRIRQANADAILLVVYPKPAAIFVRDAHKFGYKPLYIGMTAISDLPEFQKQVGIAGALDDFYSISQVGFTPDDPRMDRWRKLTEGLFPGDRLSVYNLFGIASAQVVVEVLKRAGRELTRERVKEEIEKLQNFDTGVYPGPITCTSTEHQCNKTPAWIKLEGDKIVHVVAKN
ncbi:MAG: ABC transporter substrate-binding protein [Nitrospinae bacterium]|nr:ABC transporter substrate-binding protein [Nitrospinota bacterium]